MRKLIALTLMTVAGCAAQPQRPPYLYMKANITPEQFERDKRQCAYESKLAVRRPQAVSSGSLLAEYDMLQQRKELQWDCMRAKGYNTTPQQGDTQGIPFEPDRS